MSEDIVKKEKCMRNHSWLDWMIFLLKYGNILLQQRVARNLLQDLPW